MVLREVGCVGMDYIDLAQGRDRWQAIVKAVMNIRVPQNAGNLLSSLGRFSFIGRSLLRGVSYLRMYISDFCLILVLYLLYVPFHRVPLQGNCHGMQRGNADFLRDNAFILRDMIKRTKYIYVLYEIRSDNSLGVIMTFKLLCLQDK